MKHHKLFYAYKFNKLDKMNNVLEKYKLPNLIQKERNRELSQPAKDLLQKSNS